MLLLALVAIFVPMIVEARRARQNELAQRARGGVEPAGDVYPFMQVAYPALFLVMLLEGALRGPAPGGAIAAGVAVFTAAKLLKWWAILTLGCAWTFRVIVVPGAPLVADGPYRYIPHPNYLAVAGELAGVALAAGARIAGPPALLVFGALMLRRIAVENRALESRDGL